MDSGPFGKCDPYLKLRIHETEYKTQVIKRTLAPTWNETFNFSVESEDADTLVVECYDYDMIGTHDFIGGVQISPKKLNSKTSEWYKLEHPENPEFHAEVFLTLIPIHESMEDAEKKIAAAQAEAKENAASTVLTLEVVAGRVQLLFAPSTAEPFIASGKLASIATTGKRRWNAFASVPTLMEGGMNLASSAWYGVIANASTPPEAVARLNAVFNTVLKQGEILKQLDGMGMNTTSMTSPGDFGAFIQAEVKEWEPVLRNSGIKLE